MLGLVWVLWAVDKQQANQLSEAVKDQTISVVVNGLVKSTAERHQIVANDTKSNHKYLLNLYSEQPVPWQSGDVLTVKANLKPPHGTLNDTGFDRERWLFRQGISAVGTIKSWQAEQSTSKHPMHAIHRWRAEVADQWQTLIADPEVRALLLALSVGDKSQFDRDDFKRFQDTGTAHLIAISGLHIGMMASLGYGLGWLLFALWPQQQLPRPQLQVICAWVLALFYALLAGLALPTLRALLMLSVYLLFKLIKRQAYAWDVWSLSLFLMLLFDPLGVLDWGLFMSFGAVAVLILTFQGVKHDSRWWLWIKAQWVLLLGLLPLQWLILGRITWAAPLVNFVAIPLMTILVVPLLFLVMLGQWLFGMVPDFLLSCLTLLCQGFYAFLDVFQAFPVLSLDVPKLNTWQWALLLLALLVMLLPKVVPQRAWALLLLTPLFLDWQTRLPEGHFKIQLFDVGQGLAIHVQTQRHHLLYDVGAAYDSGFNWADAVVVPGLMAQGVRQLDAVVISHQDNDHAGGLPYLMRQMDIDNVYGSSNDQTLCVKGLQWQWDGVTFEVLSPYNFTPYLRNNSSCVLKIHSTFGSILLTGDIESAVEYRLVSQNQELHSDVLLMPHHGSKTSSTENFIQAVSPQWVINSSGKHNPFKHPSPAVMSRYDVPVLDTQDLGQINLSTYPEWHHTSIRKTSPKLWRR